MIVKNLILASALTMSVGTTATSADTTPFRDEPQMAESQTLTGNVNREVNLQRQPYKTDHITDDGHNREYAWTSDGYLLGNNEIQLANLKITSRSTNYTFYDVNIEGDPYDTTATYFSQLVLKLQTQNNTVNITELSRLGTIWLSYQNIRDCNYDVYYQTALASTTGWRTTQTKIEDYLSGNSNNWITSYTGMIHSNAETGQNAYDDIYGDLYYFDQNNVDTTYLIFTIQVTTKTQDGENITFSSPQDQFIKAIKLNFDYTYVIDNTTTYEVVDIPGLLFNILVMPFAFISQAFNFTVFPGTPYALNISHIVMALIVAGILIFIIKRIFK